METEKDRWSFWCLMEDGTQEKRSAFAGTEREAREIIINKNLAAAEEKRIQEMVYTDF